MALVVVKGSVRWGGWRMAEVWDGCPRTGRAVDRDVQAPRKWSGDELGEKSWEYDSLCRCNFVEKPVLGAATSKNIRVASRAKVEWHLTGVCPACQVDLDKRVSGCNKSLGGHHFASLWLGY
jgi:hypothetical protein